MSKSKTMELPSKEELHNAQIDIPKWDYLMAKYCNMIRIADTRTYIRFPPLDEHLREDVQKGYIEVMNLEYTWSDPVIRWQIQQAIENEKMFHKEMDRIMSYIGNKSYINPAIYHPLACADISNSLFEQKRLEECKKWQEMGIEKSKTW